MVLLFLIKYLPELLRHPVAIFDDKCCSLYIKYLIIASFILELFGMLARIFVYAA